MVLNLRLFCTFRNIVTDYGEENPLFMDYYGFTPESYNLKFSSHGDAQLSQRVVELFNQVPFPSLPFPPLRSPPLFLSDFSVALL